MGKSEVRSLALSLPCGFFALPVLTFFESKNIMWRDMRPLTLKGTYWQLFKITGLNLCVRFKDKPYEIFGWKELTNAKYRSQRQKEELTLVLKVANWYSHCPLIFELVRQDHGMCYLFPVISLFSFEISWKMLFYKQRKSQRPLHHWFILSK